MKETLKKTIAMYRNILGWNGESANELMDSLRSMLQSTPFLLLQPIPILLNSMRQNRSMRFDLSRVDEPILAVDKKGFAIVGSLKSLKVMRLLKI